MHSTKNESPISPASQSVLKSLFLAARPKTWSAGICPVLIGASLSPSLDLKILLLTLLFSLFIQIGTNYANDAFDFMKGADTAARTGPKRAVAQQWIAPKTMLALSGLAFTAALLFALPLMIKTGAWSFALAALCILSGILYTGGPKPFGYFGLGELFVFIFYGPIATVGTYFLQTGEISRTALLASLAPGFLSAAILMANNLRDVDSDRLANKRTLAVRFGAHFGQRTYIAFLFGAALVPLFFSLNFASVAFLLAPIRKLLQSKEVLQETSLLLLLYTLVFCGCTLFL
jgi:1,4-dihydroxy-2-naphthoate octaprenyltransferase